MRVHPSILAPKNASKWQFPLAFALLLFLLILNLTRGPRREVVADQPIERRIEVVIAQESLEAGQPLEKASLVLEQRPVSTLPADAITTFEVLQNKVAAGPIPAGYPLAMTLLADPVPVVAIEAGEGEGIEIEDPIEVLLQEIERETVAVPILFKSNAPNRGTRVAVTLGFGKSDSLILIEDCWVSKSSGRNATLRLDPSQALIIQDARGFGSFDFIELPLEGASPYAERAEFGRSEFQKMRDEALGVQASERASKQNPDNRRKFKGYAWVTGEGTRFGLDAEGSLHVIDQNGSSMGPLRGN